jgi:hypothetical protein
MNELEDRHGDEFNLVTVAGKVVLIFNAIKCSTEE